MSAWGRGSARLVRGVTFPPEAIRWTVLDRMLGACPLAVTVRWGVGLDQCRIDKHYCWPDD